MYKYQYVVINLSVVDPTSRTSWDDDDDSTPVKRSAWDLPTPGTDDNRDDRSIRSFRDTRKARQG